MSVKLYTGNKNYSSWSIRALLVLRHAGLDYEEEVIPLDTDEGRIRLREISPTACVPVLKYNDLILWDSLSIIEFINELCPDAGIWPDDKVKRAVARSVSAEMHSGFVELRTRMPMDIRSCHATPEMVGPLENDINRIKTLWSECRIKYGNTGKFLFGKWSAADAMFAPVVSRFRTYGIELDARLKDYTESVWHMPVFQDLISEAEEETWVIEVPIP